MKLASSIIYTIMKTPVSSGTRLLIIEKRTMELEEELRINRSCFSDEQLLLIELE